MIGGAEQSAVELRREGNLRIAQRRDPSRNARRRRI